MAKKKVTTGSKLTEACNKRVMKMYVAELLNISRPTLDRKIKENDFTEEDVKILIDKKIIE